MKLLAFYPDKLGVRLLALAMVTAFLLPLFWPQALALLVALCLLLGLLFGADLLLLYRLAPVRATRIVPATIAVHHRARVKLQLGHDNPRPLHLKLVDCLPGSFSTAGSRHELDLPVRKQASLGYEIQPVVRGHFRLERVEVRVRGPLRLASARYSLPCESEIRVYPDFAAIRAYTILATDNHASQIGIFKRIARGEGSEFHQLRQYQTGDSLRQINWKATSRRNQLISNEYQRERDQQIVLLVDNGRRMRSHDGALSHFDHALNALILVSYIALRQGDSCGVLSFGHSRRWIPMGRGEGQSSVILNGLYDLQPGNSASDYIGAAEQLMLHQRKRSLVILLTNTRDEDLTDLVTACHMLGKRHLILLANIRESFIEQEVQKPVHSFNQALRYSAVQEYRNSRSTTLKVLRAQGVHCLDCTADQLAAAVSNAYLEIKSSGVL